MNLEDFTITHDPLNGISEVESNIKTSSCKKQKIQFDTEFSDCSVDQGEDENSESELPRGALKFLKINLDVSFSQILLINFSFLITRCRKKKYYLKLTIWKSTTGN